MAIQKQLMTRRQFLQTSAVITAGAALAACAPVSQQASGGSSGGASKALIELSYMTPDRELSNKVKTVSIDKFNAKMEAAGKPYRVQDIKGPATDNDLRTKLTLDAAAGNLPDIVDVYTSLLADFVAANYLLDMTPYVKDWPEWAQYYDVLKDLAAIDGKIIGLPGGTTFTFFYRKDVLQSAGISTDQPKTWDDFYAACEQIKTKTQAKPTGLPGATPWGAGTFYEGFRMVWLSFEGTIYDDADKKWVVSSPNLLKAFQVYETLAKKDYLTVDELLTPNPWEPIKYQEFPQGKCAIVTGGEWQWTFDWGPTGATPIEGLFDKVDRWQFPSEKGQPFTYVEGSASHQIAANTKSPEGSVEFVRFLGENDINCETLKIYAGGASGRKDFADACPDYKTIVGGKMFEASKLFETGRAYKFEHVGTEKLADGIAHATEDIITGKATAEEAMNKFADSMIEALGADKAKKG